MWRVFADAGFGQEDADQKGKCQLMGDYPAVAGDADAADFACFVTRAGKAAQFMGAWWRHTAAGANQAGSHSIDAMPSQVFSSCARRLI